MTKQERELPPPDTGRQTEKLPVPPGREAEDLGDPDSINAGRPGAGVPEGKREPEAPHLPPDVETPAAGTGTSRNLRPDPHADLDSGERREI